MAEDITVSINMGFTHPEFKRLLPKALRSEEYSVSPQGQGFRVDHALEDGRHLQIIVSEVKIRQITPLFRMPNVDVDLVFTGCSQAEVDDKMHIIRRGFQKGGG